MHARKFNKPGSLIRWNLLAILPLLVSVTFLALQDRGTLRVKVELATIEVVALDHDGKPVPQLTQKDFTLSEDGKDRPILSFDVVKESDPGGLPRSLSELDDQSRKGRVVLIFFDDGSIAPRQVQACREAASTYVREHMQPWDLFAVARFGTHFIIDQNLTHDVAAIEKALQQPAASVVPAERRFSLSPDLLPDATVSVPVRTTRRNQMEAPPDEEPNYRIANLARSLDSLNASLGLVKGRKSILYFGMALSPGRASSTIPSSRSGAGRDIQKTLQVANELKVTYYPVDPSDSFGLSRGLQQARDQLSHYYVLGYQPSEELSSRSRQIEVRCHVPGIKLQYSRQASSDTSNRLVDAPVEESLQKAINSSTFLGQVPLTLRLARFPGPEDRNRIALAAEIARNGLKFKRKKDSMVGEIHILGAAFDSGDKLAARFGETLNVAFARNEKGAGSPQAIPYEHTVKLPYGRYRIRLAVSDEQGKIGTVEQQLEIPKRQPDKLLMSSLVVSQQVSLLPDLVRDINSELLQSDDPLLLNGMQISLPVEYKLSRRAPMILFYEVSNLPSPDAVKQLVANVQFVSKKGEAKGFPPLSLSEVARMDGRGIVRIALKLPITDIPKGAQTLRVQTRLGKEGDSAVAEESIEITD